MPRFDPPGSLEIGIDGLLAPAVSTVVSEDPTNSEHSGRWAGGLITINRVIHDISPYADTNTSFNLLVWPASPNWKFMVLGAFMWGTFNWVSSSPVIRMGHTSLTDAILQDWAMGSGSKVYKGLAHTDYKAGFNRGLLVSSAEGNIKVTWSGAATGPLTGNVSFSVWGYAIPDVDSATS